MASYRNKLKTLDYIKYSWTLFFQNDAKTNFSLIGAEPQNTKERFFMVQSAFATDFLNQVYS